MLDTLVALDVLFYSVEAIRWRFVGVNERRMIDQMLARPSWLWQKDLEFVKSVSRQLDERRTLSSRQDEVVGRVYERFLKNQEPRFVQGGSPGGGRRR